MACLQGQSSVYKTQQTCPWRVYRDSPGSTKHNKHVHCVFTGTVQCLHNTTNMSMQCLQGQHKVYKTQQTCPWNVYRDNTMSTRHNKHVHDVLTGTAWCLRYTTNIPWFAYRDSAMSTKLWCLHVHGVCSWTRQPGHNKTQQTCPWCV